MTVNLKPVLAWLLAVAALLLLAGWVFGWTVALAATCGWVAFPALLRPFSGAVFREPDGGPNSRVPVRETVVPVKNPQEA